MMGFVEIVGKAAESFRLVVVDRHVVEHGRRDVRETQTLVPLNLLRPKNCNHLHETEEGAHGLVQRVLEDGTRLETNKAL